MTQSTRDKADYERRLRAAGIDPDGEPPEDIDDFRNLLARKIAMFMNEWRGCPEGLCRRQRGCMAPAGDCSNVPREEISQEEWDVARVDVRRALDERLREAGVMDENGRIVRDVD